MIIWLRDFKFNIYKGSSSWGWNRVFSLVFLSNLKWAVAQLEEDKIPFQLRFRAVVRILLSPLFFFANFMLFLQKLAKFNSKFLKLYNFTNFHQVGLYIIKIYKLERSFWICCHYWEYLRTFLGACRKWPFYYCNCIIILLVIAY